MREILFKAKRKNWQDLPKEQRWVEGYYIYHIKRTPYPARDSVKPEDEQHVIMQDGFSDWNMPRDTVYFEIIPETLCQFTGLTDKNDRKIWENDICQIQSDSIDEEDGYFAVEWDEDDAKFVLYNEELSIDFECCYGNECEVIGNVFDDPEKLGEAEEEAAGQNAMMPAT